MREEYKNILVVNTFGIGDVLFSTPLLGVLKERFDGASIDFMCNSRSRRVLENNRNIRELVIFEKDEFREAFRKSKPGFAGKLFGFMKRIKRGNYDLAIDLSLGHQISLLLAVLGIPERIGFNYRKRGRFFTKKLEIKGFNGKHVARYYLDILKLLGINASDRTELELEASSDASLWADDFVVKNDLGGKTLMGIAPGGGTSWGEDASLKRWPADNFAYTARKITEKKENVFFLIFGSESENALCESLAGKLPSNFVNLSGKLALPRVIALIKKCKVLLCNDGGLLHVAVAEAVGTVSIFGPVDEKVYGPYSARRIHSVITASRVDCRPCYKNFKYKKCNDRKCLTAIDRDKVVAAVLERIVG